MASERFDITRRRGTVLRAGIALAAAAAFAAPAAQAQVFNWFDPIINISDDRTGSWVDIDVSGDVPAGATGVMLEVKTEGSSDDPFGIRKKVASSPDTWMWGPDTLKNDTHTWFMIGVDSNRVFQVIQADDDVDMYLLGYTTAGVTFFDNAYDKTPPDGGYEPVDISTETGSDTAIAAIFIIHNTGGSQNWSIKMNGAADNRGSACGGSAGGDLRTNMSTMAIVGLDANEICEICIESTDIEAWLVGYVTQGAVFFQEPKQKTIGGSYTDVNISGDIGSDDANGAFVQLWADSDDRHQTGVRKNGESKGYDYDKWTSTQMAPVAIDDSNIFEAKTDDTDEMELWLYGYTILDYTNYRSIGTETDVLYQAGNASISQDAKVVTFGSATLPTNIGIGDELIIGAETFHILSRDSATQVTVQDAAASNHSGAAYTISRAYNDIQSWENDRDGDLVGENRREIGVCYNDGPFTTTTRFSDATTDASHYMTLTVAEGQRHNGTRGSGAVIDAGGGFGASVIDVQDQYVRIEWLEITNFKDLDRGIYLDDSPPSDNCVISNLLMYDFDTGAADAPILIRSENVVVRNCMIFDGTQAAIWLKVGSATIENCTIFGITGGASVGDGVKQTSGSNITIRNTICVGSNDHDFDLEGTVDYFDYNMYGTYQDFTPSGSNDQAPPADLGDLFMSTATDSENLHLQDSGHDAVDTGLSLSGDFSTDIDDEQRAGAWDMGADEIAAQPLRISSGADQTFTVGDADTAISAITITDHGETPTITAANDIRVRIPAGFNMVWDVFDTDATITGSASGKVSTTVFYEDSNRTLVVTVSSNFAAAESITISDLSFKTFSAASSVDYLGLDVDDDAVADATDVKAIQIDAAPPPPPDGTALVSWREVEPGDVPAASPATGISLDNVSPPNVSSTGRGSVSFAHTIDSCLCCSDAIIVVVTVTRGDQECTDVSYGAQALALAISEKTSSDSGNEWVKIWYRTDPLPGTNMVDVTYDGSESPDAVVALSYFGVDQSSPIGAVASDSTTSTSNPVTVNISTTVAGSIVVGGLGQHGGDTDPHDQGSDITTEHWDEVSGGSTSSDSGYAGGEIVTTTTGIYTFEWTGNVSEDWAIACIELKPAE